MTSAEFKRHLAKLGCTFEPGNGGHLKVSLGDRRSVLPMQVTFSGDRYRQNGKHEGDHDVYLQLARRLGLHLPQVDRLLDLRHASRFDQIDTALRSLGKSLTIDVRDAA